MVYVISKTELKNNYDLLKKDFYIIESDDICVEWINLWAVIIKSTIIPMLEFATSFCHLLKSYSEYNKIIKISFVTVAHIYMLDKNGSEMINDVDINTKLKHSLSKLEVNENLFEDYLCHINLWHKTREWEKAITEQQKEITLCTWLEWRQINIGFVHIGHLIFNQLQNIEDKIQCNCIMFKSKLTMIISLYISLVNDSASFKRDSILKDELNVYLLTNQKIDKESLIIEHITNVNDEFINLDIEKHCSNCRLYAQTLMSVFAGNALVSLYSERYDSKTTLLQDY